MHEIIIFFKFSALGLYLNIIYFKKIQILASIKKNLYKKRVYLSDFMPWISW